MPEVKDPAIKLFGKMIPLPPKEGVCGETPRIVAYEDPPLDRYIIIPSMASPPTPDKNCSSAADGEEDDKKPQESEHTETRQEHSTSYLAEEAPKCQETSSCENPKTPSLDKEPTSPKVSKTKDQSEPSVSQEKTLKKPDKILPCPRCNSMDTKFCYYNNYNVSQPRHFCKNCQRYWTAGGTMRNVPVGSGRRKNKSSSSSSHYRHIMLSEALQAGRIDTANAIHYPSLRPNGTILTFGSDIHLCESMNSSLNLAEKLQNSVQNDFLGPEQSMLASSMETKDDCSTVASDSIHMGGTSSPQESVVNNFQTLVAPQVPCFGGPPWPVPWRATAVPQASFGPPPGFPTLICPVPPFWGRTVPGPWNVPWIYSLPPEGPVSSSGPSSPLGKHSREGDVFGSESEEPPKENKSEGGIWVPKTLRIDDPNEAAKSSIWSTLGIKNEKIGSFIGGGLFKPLRSKTDEENRKEETSLALQANPAALSRSHNFHESAS